MFQKLIVTAALNDVSFFISCLLAIAIGWVIYRWARQKWLNFGQHWLDKKCSAEQLRSH